MYKRGDKKRIYQLIEMYLSGKITTTDFCDEYYYSYDMELNNLSLTKQERLYLDKLGKITSRFSEYKEDHLLDPKAFSTTKEVYEIVLEVKNKLSL
ncbi:hypothetical protein [Bacteroides rodentium]|uniref:hypothetical protein n=1 Tax=Bacteroides rodentium TaxID=691816 RepID=UPI0004709D84|nr:hypothetical protein [Bacteroides rodentium]